MHRTRSILAGIALAILAPAAYAADPPITAEMLVKPDPADWLMMNRTYDEQRFSPLKEITRENVGRLRMAWSRGMPAGTQESVPLVYRGVMYVYSPGGGIQALDGRTGDQIWEYQRTYPKDMGDFIGAPAATRVKSISMFEDLVFFHAPDGVIVALDMATGKPRWESKVQDYKELTQHTGGSIVVDGKVISNRTCETRAGCFIAAHDAKSGKELWKFYTTAAPGEPGGDTWGKLPAEQRVASSWGLPGSYDPVRKVLYWAIANPKPYTRLKRHGGDTDAVSRTSPSELYSNSTVALDVETGKLVWYYQHLPGDDWDSDHIHERTLVRAKFDPGPTVKWVNPAIKRGEERDMVIDVAEAGGIWALDRATGQFLWATPFPYDVPEAAVPEIDVATGRTHINWKLVFQKDGDRSLICFHNTRSFWSTAYHPGRNALYIPFHDACLDMAASNANPLGMGPRKGVLRPGVDPKNYAGIAKVDLTTGRIDRIHTQAEPGNGSALVTAGDLLFWGDLNRRLRAFDAETGKILWEQILGGMIMTSTITYAVDGRQYVAVLTGDAQSGTATPLNIAKIKTVRGHNAVYVFALP